MFETAAKEMSFFPKNGPNNGYAILRIVRYIVLSFDHEDLDP